MHRSDLNVSLTIRIALSLEEFTKQMEYLHTIEVETQPYQTNDQDYESKA